MVLAYMEVECPRSHMSVLSMEGGIVLNFFSTNLKVMIVLEMMSNGDLRNYLIKLRDRLTKLCRLT